MLLYKLKMLLLHKLIVKTYAKEFIVKLLIDGNNIVKCKKVEHRTINENNSNMRRKKLILMN